MWAERGHSSGTGPFLPSSLSAWEPAAAALCMRWMLVGQAKLATTRERVEMHTHAHLNAAAHRSSSGLCFACSGPDVSLCQPEPAAKGKGFLARAATLLCDGITLPLPTKLTAITLSHGKLKLIKSLWLPLHCKTAVACHPNVPHSHLQLATAVGNPARTQPGRAGVSLASVLSGARHRFHLFRAAHTRKREEGRGSVGAAGRWGVGEERRGGGAWRRRGREMER